MTFQGRPVYVSTGSAEGSPDERRGHRGGHPLSGGFPVRTRRHSESRGEAEPPGGADENERAVQRPERHSQHVGVRAGHGHQQHRPAEHTTGGNKRLVPDVHMVPYVFLKELIPNVCSPPLLQAKAEEELQETQGQIDSLLKDLSSLNQPGRRGAGSAQTVVDAPFSQPEGAVLSHTEMLQVRISSLCAFSSSYIITSL